MPGLRPAMSVEELKASSLPAVIFGAGPVGRLLLFACRKSGIPVVAFCDNNIHKAGTQVDGLPVIHAPALPTSFHDALFLIAVVDISDVVAQLLRLGFTRWADCALIEGVDPLAVDLGLSPEIVQYMVDACLTSHRSSNSDDRLFIRSVDVIITERCSLRCRDCSNLMQYYSAPRHCSPAEVVADVREFCRCIDEVHELRLIGGEPLMHPQVHELVEELHDEPAVGRLVIYTNGTVPLRTDQRDAFLLPKVLFMITDYGPLSRNLGRLEAQLENWRIPYRAAKAQGWAACSRIGRHGRSVAELQSLFERCCAKNLLTLSDGKLFRCPFMANLLRLQAAPDSPSDYVDLRRAKNVGQCPSTVTQQLKRFLSEVRGFGLCDFCDGRFFDSPEISPAIQSDRALSYEKETVTQATTETLPPRRFDS